MPELSDEDRNALAKAEALQRYRTTRDAFVAVFGPPGQPNVHAKIVLDYMDQFCNRARFSIALDNNGQTDVSRTFARMGLRQAADEIHRMIAWKESDHAHGS